MHLTHLLVALFLFAPLVPAQSQIYIFNGDDYADWLGFAVSGAGDVNGDGYADLVVGVPLHDRSDSVGGSGTNAGSVQVLSGKNGRILHASEGDTKHIYLGFSVNAAGDVNGDGYPDVIAGAVGNPSGAPGLGAYPGSARVFSGRDGSALYTFAGEAAYDLFGWTVDGAGDVNADGYADLLITAPEYDVDPDGTPLSGDEFFSAGRMYVYSGKDGSSLYTKDGWPYLAGISLHGFGYAAGSAGDANGDGYVDFLVGAIYADNKGPDSGTVQLFSGKDGNLLQFHDGDSIGDRLGSSVGGIGDVDGDGYDDYLVGAPFDDNTANNAGSARVFSGKDGRIFRIFDGDAAEDRFGSSVDGAGDVDGDGKVDFVVGAHRSDDLSPTSGYARVFSGLTGVSLYDLNGDAVYGNFAWSVGGAGDVNGDGYDDVIVGDYLDNNGSGSFGSARVFSGVPLPLTTDTHLMSMGVASTQNLSLDAGVGNAFKNYWFFIGFAASGDTPGVTMAPGVVIPLNQPDPLTSWVISLTQLGGVAPFFVNWRGTLNAVGKAAASLNTGGPVPFPIGITFHLAASVYTSDGCGVGCDSFQLATAWVPMTTMP